MSKQQEVTKEKHIVNADGSEHHSVSTEVKDGRSLGDKITDAKDAFKSDPSSLQQVTKVSLFGCEINFWEWLVIIFDLAFLWRYLEPIFPGLWVALN